MIFQELIDLMTPDKGNVMGHIRQFDMEEVMSKLKNNEKPDMAFHNANTQIINTYERLAEQHVHPFLVPVDQIVEFMLAKYESDDLEYFMNMKMPFEEIFIDFHGTLYENGERLKGVMISRQKNIDMMERIRDRFGADSKLLNHPLGQTKQGACMFVILGITQKMMETFRHHYPHARIVEENGQPRLAMTSHGAEGMQKVLNGIHNHSPSAIIIGGKDEDSLRFFSNEEYIQGDKEMADVGDMLRRIAIGFCLYVNSINVEILKVENGQTKKRRKQNKPIPEPYYMCRLETKEVHVSNSENQGSGPRHTYQYDVRGHFKHFKKGKMKGKVLWCPPHRRGLANSVYRPKTYNLLK